MKILCAVFLSATLVPTGALGVSSVRGRVADPEGAAVARASIRVLDAESRQTVQISQSNADGEFSIDALPAGNYLLAVSAPGFAEALLAIALPSNAQNLPQSIRLDILDCDAPDVNCDIFTSGPYTDPHPVIATRDLTASAGDAVDLDKGALAPAQSRTGSFRLDQRDSGLYLAPLNRAAFTARDSAGGCGKAQATEPLRIDGMGPASEIVMRTPHGHCARIFVTQQIPAGAGRAGFHIVTREP
jgi:Carboxypeptidase regulatory-like domain